jgi:hypothetical protein
MVPPTVAVTSASEPAIRIGQTPALVIPTP